MLLIVFVALLVAFVAVLAPGKYFAFGAFFVSAGVFAMTGYAAAGGLLNNSDDPVSLRLVTLNETTARRGASRTWADDGRVPGKVHQHLGASK